MDHRKRWGSSQSCLRNQEKYKQPSREGDSPHPIPSHLLWLYTKHAWVKGICLRAFGLPHTHFSQQKHGLVPDCCRTPFANFCYFSSILLSTPSTDLQETKQKPPSPARSPRSAVALSRCRAVALSLRELILRPRHLLVNSRGANPPPEADPPSSAASPLDTSQSAPSWKRSGGSGARWGREQVGPPEFVSDQFNNIYTWIFQL